MPNRIISLPPRTWGFIADSRLRHILARDYAELIRLLEIRAHKSTIVMCGSILEALLVYVLTSEAARQKHFEFHGQQPNVNKIEGEGLRNLIDRAADLGFLDKGVADQAGIVKEYRNLIHPNLERQSQVDISEHSVAAVVALFNNIVHLLSKGRRGRPTRTVRGTPDKNSFFAELSKYHGPADVQVVQAIYDWAETNRLEQQWEPSLTYLPILPHPNGPFKLFAIPVTAGTIVIRFGFLMREETPFRTQEGRLELLQKLNEIRGVHIGRDKLDKFPSIQPSVLRDLAARQQFLEVLDWMKQTIVLPPPR